MMITRIASLALLLNIWTLQASPVVAHNLPIRSSNQKLTPTEMLAVGIITASPSLVATAIKKGAYLRVQIDQFGDTPLMLAIRVFGHSLKTQLEAKSSRLQRLCSFASGLVISQLLMWQGSKFIPDRWQSAYNIFNLAALVGPVGYYARQSMKPTIATQRAARIILMLMQQDPQMSLRNHESLTPKDILEAFYPIARTLQSEEWFTLRRIFSQLNVG